MGAVLGHDDDVHRGDTLCHLLATHAAREDHRVQQALLAAYLSQARTRLSISYGEDSHLVQLRQTRYRLNEDAQPCQFQSVPTIPTTNPSSTKLRLSRRRPWVGVRPS
jgi:hypothetical protein